MGSYAQTHPALITPWLLALPKPQIIAITGRQRRGSAGIKPSRGASSHTAPTPRAPTPTMKAFLVALLAAVLCAQQGKELLGEPQESVARTNEEIKEG